MTLIAVIVIAIAIDKGEYQAVFENPHSWCREFSPDSDRAAKSSPPRPPGCHRVQTGLHEGRRAISHIVGRDPQSLDRAGIARAAIESLSENFSDGSGGADLLSGARGLARRCCLQSHQHRRQHDRAPHAAYEAFGWAAARLDDVVNLPASRLSALLIIAAAALVPGCSGVDSALIRLARCRPASLAQRRLAGGRHGGSARLASRRPANLCGDGRQGTHGWGAAVWTRIRWTYLKHSEFIGWLVPCRRACSPCSSCGSLS